MAKAEMQDCCNDAEAAAMLSGDHPKSKPVKQSWGMRDRSNDGDGPDDDARKPSFNKGDKL